MKRCVHGSLVRLHRFCVLLDAFVGRKNKTLINDAKLSIKWNKPFFLWNCWWGRRNCSQKESQLWMWNSHTTLAQKCPTYQCSKLKSILMRSLWSQKYEVHPSNSLEVLNSWLIVWHSLHFGHWYMSLLVQSVCLLDSFLPRLRVFILDGSSARTHHKLKAKWLQAIHPFFYCLNDCHLRCLLL